MGNGGGAGIPSKKRSKPLLDKGDVASVTVARNTQKQRGRAKEEEKKETGRGGDFFKWLLRRK